MKLSKIYQYFLLILVLSGSGCQKFIQIPPPASSLISQTVFSTNASANQAQLSIYSQFVVNTNSYKLTLYTGLSSDELINYSTTLDNIQLFTNGLINTNGATSSIWSSCYNFIYQANAVLDGINSSSTLDPNVVKQLKGEAKFTRAFMYFYLVNLFGPIPLDTTVNYNNTIKLSRSDTSQVYNQIISDLKDAEVNLSNTFLSVDGITQSSERLRPTTWAASALLARVYLYLKDYANAMSEASKVIGNTGMFSLVTDLNKVFKANSLEAIWQATEAPNNTYTGLQFILTSTPGVASLSTQLESAFENNDKRQQNWVKTYLNGPKTYYYAYKYQVNTTGTSTEYDMLLRLAEQFLIRSEAEANGAGNGISAAITDLNTIRTRAGLNGYAGPSTKDSVIAAIMRERRVELFTELGHRWLDLKRTGSINSVMDTTTTQKGGAWKSTQQLYPIPQADRVLDNNLSQNDGY